MGENKEGLKTLDIKPKTSKGNFWKTRSLLNRRRSSPETGNTPAVIIPQIQTEEETSSRIIERSKNHKTYVGLEKFSAISKDEELYQNYLKYFTETAEGDESRTKSIEDFKSRLNAIKEKKKALLDECGINDEMRQRINTNSGVNIENLHESSSVRSLLVEQLARELPPVAEGYQRLFRGEGPIYEGTSRTAGKWFHYKIKYASAFPGAWSSLKANSINCRYLYVDIPQRDLKKYHANEMKEFHGSSKAGEFLVPDEIKSQEFARFITADTVVDPWTTFSVGAVITK